MEKKPYTIGLDIGTNSVGWAVLTENYDLVKRKMKIKGNTDKKYMKKNFWGVRLFDAGETAEARRMKRTARRRLARRRNRLEYLQGMFQEEMAQVDPNFFHRLDESFYVVEDKVGAKQPIFGKVEEEVSYHKDYPTIYHLRKELVDSKEQQDLRLVYLALAHIVKYRGHFLIEGKLSTENISVAKTYQEFVKVYNQTFATDDNLGAEVPEDIECEELLTANFSRAKRADNVIKEYRNEKSNGTFVQFIKMIVGNQGNFKKSFDLEEDAKLQFSSEDFEEELELLIAQLDDSYLEVFEAAQAVYNAVELSQILDQTDEQTRAKFSASMVKRYRDHGEDLTLFKQFIRENKPKAYGEMFKNEDGKGYAGYIAHGGKVSRDEFYKTVKKLIQGLDGAEYFLEKIETETFLLKQRTFENGVIPNQIHLEELRYIIENQAQYYPFLRENQEKIEHLVTFRIPYYIGPLASGQSEFAWLTRTSDKPIRPWNIKEKVDYSQSATEFIERMTVRDEYLPTEKTLPRHSMLYEKYTVFNELTRVIYLDERGNKHFFSTQEKQDIFNHLFKKDRRVTKKKLITFLKTEYLLEVADIKGIEEAFNAKYNTYHDLQKLGFSTDFLDEPKNEEMLEDIIKILTVFEDRKMVREQLKVYADQLDAAIMTKLTKKHYTGWGRLSKKLLTEIKDEQTNKSILEFLQEDPYNRNFMQLINDTDLSFKKIISQEQQEKLEDDLETTVYNLPGSPAIKKGILQSLKIVDELVGIMGYNPSNIVIEMARENQSTSYGKNKSKQRLKHVENAMKELGSNLLKETKADNRELQNDLQKDRLYLYYLQNGRDMYTGKEIPIEDLSHYDIDHVIPRSFTTDNSLDNLVLVSSKENRGKSDDVPSEEVVRRMKPLWIQLLNAKAISKRKFDNLTKGERGGLTEEDKMKFMHRQLVETRQITKQVAQILHQRFNQVNEVSRVDDLSVKIITLKASLTSEFREQFKLYKVREVNDYHHAQDAYLNGVVGTTLLKLYPQLAPEFVYGTFMRFNFWEANKATAKKKLYSNLIANLTKDLPVKDNTDKETGEILWSQKDIKQVKKVYQYRQMNMVKKVEKQTGGFYKETVKPKGKSNKLIPRKNGWDTTKYGGFDSPVVTYSVLIEHLKGKKQVKTKDLIGITIAQREGFEKEPTTYLTDLGYVEPKVLKILPKFSVYECENGRRRLLASDGEAQKGNQMVLPTHLMTLLYHAKHYGDILGKSTKYVAEHRQEFDEIIQHVKVFNDRYTLADSNMDKILAVYAEKGQSASDEELSKSFIELMSLNAMKAASAFNFLGESIDRRRYTSTKELLDSTLIHQSITGLYETRWKVSDL